MIVSMAAAYDGSLRRNCAGVLLLSAMLLVGVGGWAFTAELSGAVVSEGSVIVENNVKKIQHPTGGVIKKVAVLEGDRVVAGQLLVELDGTAVRSSLSIVESTLAQLYIRRARLDAELRSEQSYDVPQEAVRLISSEALARVAEGEKKLFVSRIEAAKGMRDQLASRKKQLRQEAEGLRAQISALNDQLEIVGRDVENSQRLLKQGLILNQRYDAIRRDQFELMGERGARMASLAQTDGKASEIDLQMLQLEQDKRTEVSKDLTDIEAKISEYEDRRIASTDQLRRLEVKSPVAGRVYQLAVHTVDAVVSPADTLMIVVPEADNLLIEARVAPKDIDQIHVGQKVTMRFTAFNQQTTPEVEATVVNVAPDLIVDSRTGVSYYPIRTKPLPESLTRLGPSHLYPGMPVEVFLKTGERTAISYLIKPIADQIRRSMREE